MIIMQLFYTGSRSDRSQGGPNVAAIVVGVLLSLLVTIITTIVLVVIVCLWKKLKQLKKLNNGVYVTDDNNSAGILFSIFVQIK